MYKHWWISWLLLHIQKVKIVKIRRYFYISAYSYQGYTALVHGKTQSLIQDFPDGSANPKGGANLLFGKFFAQNCMKLKEIGPRGERTWSYTPPPRPRSANETVTWTEVSALLSKKWMFCVNAFVMGISG